MRLPTNALPNFIGGNMTKAFMVGNPSKTEPFIIRKIAQSGNSKYLNVNFILPSDWLAVKVYAIEESVSSRTLKIEKIA